MLSYEDRQQIIKLMKAEKYANRLMTVLDALACVISEANASIEGSKRIIAGQNDVDAKLVKIPLFEPKIKKLESWFPSVYPGSLERKIYFGSSRTRQQFEEHVKTTIDDVRSQRAEYVATWAPVAEMNAKIKQGIMDSMDRIGVPRTFQVYKTVRGRSRLGSEPAGYLMDLEKFSSTSSSEVIEKQRIQNIQTEAERLIRMAEKKQIENRDHHKTKATEWCIDNFEIVMMLESIGISKIIAINRSVDSGRSVCDSFWDMIKEELALCRQIIDTTDDPEKREDASKRLTELLAAQQSLSLSRCGD